MYPISILTSSGEWNSSSSSASATASARVCLAGVMAVSWPSRTSILKPLTLNPGLSDSVNDFLMCFVSFETFSVSDGSCLERASNFGAFPFPS